MENSKHFLDFYRSNSATELRTQNNLKLSNSAQLSWGLLLEFMTNFHLSQLHVSDWILTHIWNVSVVARETKRYWFQAYKIVHFKFTISHIFGESKCFWPGNRENPLSLLWEFVVVPFAAKCPLSQASQWDVPALCVCKHSFYSVILRMWIIWMCSPRVWAELTWISSTIFRPTNCHIEVEQRKTFFTFILPLLYSSPLLHSRESSTISSSFIRRIRHSFLAPNVVLPLLAFSLVIQSLFRDETWSNIKASEKNDKEFWKYFCHFSTQNKHKISRS